MEYIDSLNHIIDSSCQELGGLYGQLSRYDLQIQDLLHYIENEKYDAPTGSKIIKEIKNIRKLRRDVKIKIDKLHPMIEGMKAIVLKSQRYLPTNYNYRTNICSKYPIYPNK